MASARKEREPHVALACGEGFQKLAAEFIPRIRAIPEETHADSFPNELGQLVACATNLAFAIELYLKALLTLSDLPVPQTHDLRALYDAIPQPVRAVVEDVYDTKAPEQVRQLHGHASFTLAKGPLEKPVWDDHTRVRAALPDLLARSKDLFQSWRYVFEFSPHEDSPYQFHQFEYALLWCAAEALRVEVTVRLGEARWRGGEGAPEDGTVEGEYREAELSSRKPASCTIATWTGKTGSPSTLR